ncbi:MAG: polyprenyl diphosphate synthase [Desulfomonilia bacterium]
MTNRLQHLAIIMDGNGRWAQRRGMSRLKGHEMGSQAARRIVEAVKERGIEYLTLYAFSSENWNRPKEEIEGLFRLLERFIDTEINRLKTSGVCIHVIGDVTRFPQTLQNRIRMTLEETSLNRDIHLSIALNYGGRDEIIRAIRSMDRGGVKFDELDETLLSSYLDTSSMPDPDLMIRTGGEWRISNFLLWQLAYTEIYFTDILWPDFDEKALDNALKWFYTRQRRFGMTGEQVDGSSL